MYTTTLTGTDTNITSTNVCDMNNCSSSTETIINTHTDYSYEYIHIRENLSVYWYIPQQIKIPKTYISMRINTYARNNLNKRLWYGDVATVQHVT